jgi:amino acid permease
MSIVLGTGLLACPQVISHMGILLGTMVIIWSALTAAFGLYLQSRCARYLDRGTSSFFALSQMTYPNAAVVFDTAIAVKCFGVGVSYLIIIGDLMPGVVRGFNAAAGDIPFLVDRQFWITAFMYVKQIRRPCMILCLGLSELTDPTGLSSFLFHFCADSILSNTLA